MEESSIWDYEANHKLYPEIYKLSDLTKSLGFNHEHGIEEAEEIYDFLRKKVSLPAAFR